MARPQYHHGDLHAAALDAVAELIADGGAAAVTLRAVAQRVGVSHAAPAHHFGNKSGLITAFAARGFHRLADTMEHEVSDTAPQNPARRLEALGVGYVRFALDDPESFAVMFRDDLLDVHNPEYVAASLRAYRPLMDTVAACGEAGLLGDRSADDVAVAAWSLVHGLATLWIGGRLFTRLGERDPVELSRAVCRLFVDEVLLD